MFLASWTSPFEHPLRISNSTNTKLTSSAICNQVSISQSVGRVPFPLPPKIKSAPSPHPPSQSTPPPFSQSSGPTTWNSLQNSSPPPSHSQSMTNSCGFYYLNSSLIHPFFLFLLPTGFLHFLLRIYILQLCPNYSTCLWSCSLKSVSEQHWYDRTTIKFLFALSYTLQWLCHSLPLG